MTGSGCREHSYGGFGGGHPHFHPHAPGLLIRRYPRRHPDSFRSVRDLGPFPARCSGESGLPQGCSSGWLPACSREGTFTAQRAIPGSDLFRVIRAPHQSSPRISSGLRKGIGFARLCTLTPPGRRPFREGNRMKISTACMLAGIVAATMGITSCASGGTTTTTTTAPVQQPLFPRRIWTRTASPALPRKPGAGTALRIRTRSYSQPSTSQSLSKRHRLRRLPRERPLLTRRPLPRLPGSRREHPDLGHQVG